MYVGVWMNGDGCGGRGGASAEGLQMGVPPGVGGAGTRPALSEAEANALFTNMAPAPSLLGVSQGTPIVSSRLILTACHRSHGNGQRVHMHKVMGHSFHRFGLLQG